MKLNKIIHHFIIQLLFFLLFCGHVIAQDKLIIERYEKEYQICLNNENDMLNCAKKFYKQMDSMLNVIYKDLINNPLNNRIALKEEQLNWLKRRNRKFILIDKAPKEKGLSSYDNEMIIIDKKSMFVKERVIELIDR